MRKYTVYRGSKIACFSDRKDGRIDVRYPQTLVTLATPTHQRSLRLFTFNTVCQNLPQRQLHLVNLCKTQVPRRHTTPYRPMTLNACVKCSFVYSAHQKERYQMQKPDPITALPTDAKAAVYTRTA